MKNLTESIPKCLLHFQDQSLLSWQLNSLHASGIKNIAIVTGYKRELLNHFDLVEFFNPQWNETNMVASLICAREWLRSEPCVVSYSDIFYLPEAIGILSHCPAPLSITYDPKWFKLWKARFEDPLEDAESFKLRAPNILVEIGKKSRNVEEIQGQYMGLLKFTPESWRELERLYGCLDQTARNSIHMTGMLQLFILQSKIPVVALPYHGEWYEFDSATDLNLKT